MPRRVIDLSQSLSRQSQLHRFFPPTQILRHIQHSDAAPGEPSFNANLTDRYPTHRACAERGLTHYENLNSLVEVLGERFEFYGFPLKLETAYGSPVRAVAIVDS